MTLSWAGLQVHFIRGGSSHWHPKFELNQQWFRRNLIDYDLWYIVNGEGYLRDAGDHVTALGRGTCLLMRPGSVFHIWQKAGNQLETRYFHFDIFDASGQPVPPDALSDIPLACEINDRVYINALTHRLTDLIATIPLMPGSLDPLDAHQAVSVLLKGFLTEFVLACRLKHRQTAGDIAAAQLELVSRVVAQIHEDPARFDLASCLGEAGYSMDHFRRLFKHVVGQTPHQAQIKARIERAKYLLECSNLSVGEIAQEVGYASVYYFSLQFKAVVGAAPTSYREGHC